MAAPFQVNIVINAGVDYVQQFTLTQADKSPLDITGCEFYASLSKYPRALNAVLSTADEPVYERFPFTATIVDGIGGQYAISMSGLETGKLLEGKYVYSVVMRDLNGQMIPTVQGLAFVDIALGAPLPPQPPKEPKPSPTNSII